MKTPHFLYTALLSFLVLSTSLTATQIGKPMRDYFRNNWGIHLDERTDFSKDEILDITEMYRFAQRKVVSTRLKESFAPIQAEKGHDPMVLINRMQARIGQYIPAVSTMRTHIVMPPPPAHPRPKTLKSGSAGKSTSKKSTPRSKEDASSTTGTGSLRSGSSSGSKEPGRRASADMIPLEDRTSSGMPAPHDTHLFDTVLSAVASARLKAPPNTPAPKHTQNLRGFNTPPPAGPPPAGLAFKFSPPPGPPPVGAKQGTARNAGGNLTLSIVPAAGQTLPSQRTSARRGKAATQAQRLVRGHLARQRVKVMRTNAPTDDATRVQSAISAARRLSKFVPPDSMVVLDVHEADPSPPPPPPPSPVAPKHKKSSSRHRKKHPKLGAQVINTFFWARTPTDASTTARPSKTGAKVIKAYHKARMPR